MVEGGQATEAESPAMGCSSHPLSGQEPPVLPPCPHDLYQNGVENKQIGEVRSTGEISTLSAAERQ